MRLPVKLRMVLLATLLVGCEGVVCADGVVSDAATREPLAGVQCREGDGGTAVTDAAGHYEVCSGVRGCTPGGDCGDLVVTFSKAGYVTRTVKDPHDVALDPG